VGRECTQDGGGDGTGQAALVRTAIVVPGHGKRGRDGVYRISATCLGLVREAERIAERSPVDVVVFSGWSRTGGPTEAEQMRDSWRGPQVELVLEPTASVTAENAARTVPLLVARGIERAIVVCAPLHRHRTRFFFSRLYGAHGIETEVRVAQAAPSLRALLWEVGAASGLRRQLRAARAELQARRP
jgi:uncharacterized SAM-binding protein YcdF (DUF218 family)